jgi:hypothetical protein
MKPNDLADLRQITSLLQSGVATRRDMIALLILIREHLSKTRQPMLLDISHCVAHSRRDRGLAYDYIERFLEEFINAARSGGILRVRVLFPMHEVVEELVVALEDIGVANLDRETLQSQADHVEILLKSVLDEVTLQINHDNISKCSFEAGSSKQGDYFSFRTYFKGLEDAPVLQIPINVAIAFPVFK